MSNDIELPDLPPLKTVAWMTPIGTVWVTKGPTDDKPLVLRSDAEAAILADRAKRAQEVQTSAAWENSEGWESLAWELCADENGEEACNELIWEGGPIPEPWGERWLKYEGEAKRLIALVQKHFPVEASKPVQAEAPSDEQLREAFTKDTGGPNPFYRCKLCGETEPGLQEYLVAHWRKHRATPPAPCGAVEREALISKLCNVRAMAAERLPKVDVETIDEAIGALATSPTASGVGERDSYEAIWNALHEIDSAAVFLPTFKVNHEGGLEAFTKNIVEAIQAAAIATQPLEQKPVACKGIPRKGCGYLAFTDTVCNKCGEVHHHHQMVAAFDAQPEQVAQDSAVDPTLGSCAECGVKSTKNSMWALYCLPCVHTKIAPALQAEQASEQKGGA